MNLLLRGTQICRIYISLCIQCLKAFQNNLTSPVRLHSKIHPSGQVLTEINHSFPVGCHNHFPGLKLFHFPHPAARLGRERFHRELNSAYLFPFPFIFRLQSGIIPFSVVNLRKSYWTGSSLPAFVRHENLFPAILIPHYHLHQKSCSRTVIVPQ